MVSSLLDALIYSADVLPTFVAKAETLKWPLISTFVKAMQCITVRERERQQGEEMKQRKKRKRGRERREKRERRGREEAKGKEERKE